MEQDLFPQTYNADRFVTLEDTLDRSIPHDKECGFGFGRALDDSYLVFYVVGLSWQSMTLSCLPRSEDGNISTGVSSYPAPFQRNFKPRSEQARF